MPGRYCENDDAQATGRLADILQAKDMANPKNVLVADDSGDDFVLIRQAFRRAGLPHKLDQVLDGEQALAYLMGEPPFSDRKQFPFPDLMLLDVMMPRATGFDVLSFLRERPDVPVPLIVILSGSVLPEDSKKALELGAKEYFTKPREIKGFTELARTIDERWLREDVSKT